MSELRDYQAEAVEKIKNAMKASKTIVASRIMERAVQRGERVLVLTHRREILKHTSLQVVD